MQIESISTENELVEGAFPDSGFGRIQNDTSATNE